MKTKTTAALEVILNIPPLHLFVRKIAAAEVYRLLVGGNLSDVEVKDLHDISKRMLCQDHILAMQTDVILRKLSFMEPFKVIFSKSEKWHDEERREELCYISSPDIEA